MASESPEPDMSYQQAAGGGGVGPGGGDVEWDPEALGHALLTADSAWSAVSNLDAFFTKVYVYYVERGFWCMIATRVTNLLTLAFTICFSTFLLLFIQWNSLLFCSNNEECDDVVGLRQHVFTAPTTGDLIVFIYFGVFCLFWCWNFLSFFYSLKDALEMRAFYRDDLRISDEDLVSLEWHYILDSLVALQVSGRKKLCIVRDLSALDITNRIMRKDNYMIALVNLDIFQLGPRSKIGVWNATPQCGGCCSNESRRRQQRTQLKEVQQQHAQLQQQKKTLRERKPQTYNVAFPANNKPLLAVDSGASDAPTSQHAGRVHDEYQSIGSPSSAMPPQSIRAPFVGTAGVAAGSMAPRIHSGSLSSWWSWAMLGTTLDWNLRFCVLNSLFDAHFSIHSSYLGASGINALKARFIGMGLINLLLSPFILLFMIIFFFLKHAEEFQSKRTLFGPRQWCNLAQWKIREWNELPHFFERRLVLSSVAAQQYMSQFPNTLVAIIAQSVAYICGAVVAVLLLLTVTDGDVISHRIGDRTLLWYLAMFSALLALSRSMIPDKSIYPAPALVMSEVIKHTHYSPQHWKGLWHTAAVHRELSYMYPSRLSMFAYEIMSVVMTPFVLIFCLPHSAERIVQFVTTRTVNVQGVGHLCSYAMFDIDKYGDQRYAQMQTVDFSPEAVASNAKGADGKEAGGSGPGSKVPSRQHSSSGAPLTPAAAPFPLRPKQGKMEKSFLSFSMHNPHWKAENDGASASAGGQRFLQSIADSMYGSGRQYSDHTPPMLSRESSEPRRGRVPGSLKAASSSALPPPSIGFTRQDSLDSSTTDENDGEFKPEEDDEKQRDMTVGAKSSASELLSQSDRNALVQSFADLMGLDSSLAAHLNPSTMMRQSSMGSAHHPVGGASTLGMSTMLGINQRRGGGVGAGGYPQPLSSPRRATSGGGMNQSVLLRSQLGSHSFNPSNSVLLNQSLLRSTSGGGGLQGGLTASAMLHLDPQAMREQLMLAQADQQADLFALLESRLADAPPGVVDEGEEGAEQAAEDSSDDDDHAAQSARSHISHAPPAFLATTYTQPAQQQQRTQTAAAPATTHTRADTDRSGLSPQPLQRHVSDDNEPPPLSFITQ